MRINNTLKYCAALSWFVLLGLTFLCSTGWGIEPQKETITGQTRLLVRSIPEAGGITMGTGSYQSGGVAKIIAVPTPDFSFVRWEGGRVLDATNPNTEIFLDAGNQVVTAAFSPLMYTVSVQIMPIGAGQVVGGGSLARGANPKLRVTANEGYVFAGWDGPVAEKNKPETTLREPLSMPVTLVARFDAIRRKHKLILKCEPENAGKVTGSGNFEHGKNTPIKVEPKPGYVFNGWTGNVANPGETQTEVFLTGDAVVTANFTVQKSLIRASVSPSEAGRVTGELGARPLLIPAKIKAEPNDGYIFEKWDGPVADPKSAETTITPTTGKVVSVTANFKRVR